MESLATLSFLTKQPAMDPVIPHFIALTMRKVETKFPGDRVLNDMLTLFLKQVIRYRVANAEATRREMQKKEMEKMMESFEKEFPHLAEKMRNEMEQQETKQKEDDEDKGKDEGDKEAIFKAAASGPGKLDKELPQRPMPEFTSLTEKPSFVHLITNYFDACSEEEELSVSPDAIHFFKSIGLMRDAQEGEQGYGIKGDFGMVELCTLRENGLFVFLDHLDPVKLVDAVLWQ